jgi:hypothetical protein
MSNFLLTRTSMKKMKRFALRGIGLLPARRWALKHR